MNFPRSPETEAVMEDQASVTAFHKAGEPGGPLFPIYHFNAVGLAGLSPKGGTVLDVGCGPGVFLEYVLEHRTDLTGIGFDLSETMLRVAGEVLDERASLVQGDFTQLHELVDYPVDTIACLSALHHCTSFEQLVDVLISLRVLRERHGSAVWLFDLVRPKEEIMASLIPRTFEVSSGQRLEPAFRADWTNSLKAGWTYEEFLSALGEAKLEVVSSTDGFSQLHWTGEPDFHDLWNGSRTEAGDLERANKLREALGGYH